jgi:hypothetical protein
VSVQTGLMDGEAAARTQMRALLAWTLPAF